MKYNGIMQALLPLLVLGHLHLTPVSCHCNFPAIFSFGDSNADSGGLSLMFGPVSPPYGSTFFGRPEGRFSDGRLMVDFIAKSLGLPYLSSYLDSLALNVSHGVNFAMGAATVRPPNTSFTHCNQLPFSLDMQVRQYSQFKNRSLLIQKERTGFFPNLVPKKDYFSQALHTIDIGQNDLVTGLFYNLTTREVKTFVPDVVYQITVTIKNLYDLGARYFWVHNTGPFGCLVYVVVRKEVKEDELDKAGCAEKYNEIAQYFNYKLKKAVVELRKELQSAAITYVDIYSVKYKLIREAKQNGFESPFKVCCGHGGKYNYDRLMGCGSSVMVNGTSVLVGKSCPDPSVRIVWDGVHFTEAANSWVFNKIVNGRYSDPPLPLNMACYSS